MIKRIERWLVGIFQKELAKMTVEITLLRSEIAELKTRAESAAMGAQTHVEDIAEGLKRHAKEVAVDIHTKIAEDAKTILKFQQTVRLGCSFCGQLSRTYDLIDGKIKCADCQKKGVK